MWEVHSAELLCVFSQNHRMVEAGKDPWKSPYPTPLLELDHLEHVDQDHVQMAFKYLQELTFHNLSGRPVTVLAPPCITCAVKKCFYVP